jgi:DNA repair protein RadD
VISSSRLGPHEPKQLFDYQEEAITLLRKSLSAGHRRPLVQLPTGAGKTVIAGAIVNGALAKGKRAIFTVPSLPLINQTVRSFLDDGINAVGVMQAFHHMTDAAQPVQVCSVQTLARRKIPPTDVVIVDEAHILHKSMIAWMRDPDWADVPFIGLSATPWTRGLGKVFDDLIRPVTMQELIERGRLSKFQVFSHNTPDLVGVRTVRGDFDQEELAEAVDRPNIVGDVVKTWLQKGEDRPTVAYCVNRSHARHIAELFGEAGVAVAYVDCMTNEAEREDIFRRFRAGEIRVICNVAVLTTGFDSDVRAIVDAKPTRSEMLYVQTIGRGLRTAPGKDQCLILDHAGNAVRLGLVTDIDHDRLDAGEKRERAEKVERKEPLPRLCDECKAVIPAKAEVCPVCGTKKHAVTLVQHEDGELTEYGSPHQHRRSLDGSLATGFLGELKWIARERGYAQGWIKHKFRERFGRWPFPCELARAEPGEPGLSTKNWIRSRQIAYAKARAHG